MDKREVRHVQEVLDEARAAGADGDRRSDKHLAERRVARLGQIGQVANRFAEADPDQAIALLGLVTRGLEPWPEGFARDGRAGGRSFPRRCTSSRGRGRRDGCPASARTKASHRGGCTSPARRARAPQSARRPGPAPTRGRPERLSASASLAAHGEPVVRQYRVQWALTSRLLAGAMHGDRLSLHRAPTRSGVAGIWFSVRCRTAS